VPQKRDGAQGEQAPDRLKVFISYSRRDLEAADQIVAALEERGFAVTIDRRDLPYGEEWLKELADFIFNADTVVWLVSPNSVQSKACKWELSEVRALNKRLIPVAIAPVPFEDVPEALGRIHFLPAVGPFSLTQHLDALEQTLHTDRQWIKEHTRLADRARQWIARGRPGALLLRGSALKDAESWQDRRPATAPAPSDEILALMLASRRAATVRQRQIVAISVSAAIFATALAAAAAWQWWRAETTYAAARGTVSDLIDELAVGMQSIEGMRVATINRSLDVVQKLVGDLQDKSGGDPLLEAVRATMFYQFAKTYQRVQDRSSAIKASDRSLTIREALLSKDPRNEAWRWGMVEGLQLAGDLERERNDPKRAREYYERASSEAAILTEKNAGESKYAVMLSQVLVRLGDLDRAERNNTAAKGRYQQAYQRTSAAVRQSHGAVPVDLQRELSWNYNKLGDVETAIGNFPEALAQYEKGLCVREALSAGAPEQTEWRRDVSWTFERMAGAQARTGELQKALVSQFGSLAIRRRLVATDSSRLIWLRDLGSTLHQVADLYVKLDNPSYAIAFYLAAADVRRDLQKRSPGDPDAAKSAEESMTGAALARERLVARGPLAPERVWREVVSEEEQNAVARALQSGQDPQVCWNKIVSELRALGP
jgi:tetratricopeptide (TPR) repeat protein